MPTDPRKRQKKQEKRAAKRKAKRHELVKAKHAGVVERLDAVADAPVLDSFVSLTLWDQGLGWVCLSRQLPHERVAFAVFLVDRYCLGVKNAIADVSERSRYESQIVRKMRTEYQAQDLPPAAIRKLVEGAVEYARALGFHPHPDYQKAKHIFGSIDAGESKEVFEYGQDGQPYYFAGPNEDAARARQIVKTLELSCGPGNFNYTIPLVPGAGVLSRSPSGEAPFLLGGGDEDDFEEGGDEEAPE